MRKVETVDDIYYLDAELSDPVIKQSYIAQAKSDPDSFEIIEDEDGSRGVFLRTTTGLYPIGAAEPRLDLAAADAGTMSDAPSVVAGTVRPGAMQGEMRAIPQSKFEKILESTGLTLEQVGQELDKLGKVSIAGVEIGLRDFLPFVGGTEQVEDPRTGQTVTKEVGTPQALKMAGRGESLTTGTGMTTQLKPDVKAAAMDVGLTVAPVAKQVGQAAVKAVKATKDLPVGASTKAVGSSIEQAIAPKRRRLAVRQDGEIKYLSEFPRVDEIKQKNIGPGSIKPRVIADGKPLFRETSPGSLSDLLRYEEEFDVPSIFVTDKQDLAIGQGSNVGVMIQFRPNSISGEIRKKPGTSPETGMEYMTDIIAPRAIEKITMKSQKQLKVLSPTARKLLTKEFDKQELEGGEIVFTRKGL